MAESQDSLNPVRRRLCAAVLLAALVCTALAQEKDDPLSRDKFEQQRLQFSTIAPAEASLSAWIKVGHMPFWHDSNGSSPAWEEIGPKPIRHGWGDMDNAGRTSAIVVDPTDSRTVYIGAASGGVWKSTDGCQSWAPIADHEPSLCYGAIALDPFNHKIVYAGTGEAHNSGDSFAGVGLLRSRDGGIHWELLGGSTFVRQSFARIVPHPGHTGFIYAATTGGVYRSTDGGGTWVQLLRGPATDLIVNNEHPNSMIAAIGRSSGSSTNGLYKTVDEGEHWTRLTEDLPENGRVMGRIQMGNCASYPNVVYVSVFASYGPLLGIYKSTDFGHTWVSLPAAPDYGGGQAWYDNYLAVNPVNPNVVFVGGTSTYRTTDGGQSWADNTRSYAGGPIHPDHHYMTFDPGHPQTAYLGTDGGVFRTRDLGETWESVCDGLGTVQFEHIDVHPWDKNIDYGGTQDNGTNKYTGTVDWQEVFFGDGGVTRVNWKDPNVVYTEYVDLTIAKSPDGGRNWFDCTHGIDLRDGELFYSPYNFDPSDPDILVAGTRRVYRTTDAATNWSAISPFLGGPISAVNVAPNNSAVIYAGTSDGRVWVTPNTGTDWYEISKGLPRGYIGDICIDPRNARHLYVGQVAWGGNRIWETFDAGGTWSPAGDGLPEAPVRSIALDPSQPDTVFIGTEVGVFVSTNGGARWERYGHGLPNAPIFAVKPNVRTGYLTVGTHGRGAWRVAMPG